MKHRKIYETFFNKVLVCRGTVDDIAEALYVSTATARTYVNAGRSKWVTIEPQPILYEARKNGELIHRETCQELACTLGVKERRIRQAAQEGSLCAGFEINKYTYPMYMMKDEDRYKLVKNLTEENPPEPSAESR